MKTLKSEEIMERYIDWLRDNIKLKTIKQDVLALQSPFVDVHNDFITIYIRRLTDNTFYLTDDGVTFYDLKTMGFQFTPQRKNYFDIFINGQGVKFNEKTGELYVHSDWEQLPQKKNDLIQSIINIGDMFLTSEAYVKSLFFEEVAEYFIEKKILFTPDVFIEGQGFRNKVDFVVPKHNNEEILVKLINNPTKANFKNFIFTFMDISNGSNKLHASASKVLFINDNKKEITQTDLNAISKYDIHPVLWSKREERIALFQ